jgi:hypothetical protein
LTKFVHFFAAAKNIFQNSLQFLKHQKKTATSNNIKIGHRIFTFGNKQTKKYLPTHDSSYSVACLFQRGFRAIL